MTYKEASRDVVIPGGHVYDIDFTMETNDSSLRLVLGILNNYGMISVTKIILKGIALTISNWYKNRRMKWRI